MTTQPTFRDGWTITPSGRPTCVECGRPGRWRWHAPDATTVLCGRCRFGPGDER